MIYLIEDLSKLARKRIFSFGRIRVLERYTASRSPPVQTPSLIMLPSIDKSVCDL